MPTPSTDRVYRLGDVVTAVVTDVSADALSVWVWGVSLRGVVPMHQLSRNADGEPCVIEPDESLHAMVLAIEENQIALSVTAVQRLPAWSVIAWHFEEDRVVRGPVIEVRPGGLMIDLGLPAFIPESLVELRRSRDLNLTSYLGQTLEAKLIEFDGRRNSIVLSRRAWLEEQGKPERDAFMSALSVGEPRDGVVSSIHPTYGVIIDLGLMCGEIGPMDATPRVAHLRSGDDVVVRILGVDFDRERIALALIETNA